MLASKQKLVFFSLFSKVLFLLEIIGKPFYFLALTLFLGFIYVSHLLGQSLLWIGRKTKEQLIRLWQQTKPPKLVFPNRKAWLGSFLVIVIFFFITVFYLQILKDLPNPEKLITRNQTVSTKIYDRKGELLYQIYRNQNRTLVKLNDIPLFLRQATIAIEDAEFYSHHGLSFKGMARAVGKILQERKIEGGSTITQQLVKNALLTPERSIKRKIKEIILALRVETQFSKDEILQMYLNEVGFGGAVYGVEEASRYYFGKQAKDINLAEAALLAGLPASPTTYSPFGAHPELARERQLQVLYRMAQSGFITADQAKNAEKQELNFVQPVQEIKAPHFVMFVKDLLVKKYGEKLVEEGGLEVKTSLDLSIQEMAQEKVTSEIEKIRTLKIGNGAALVTIPKTGEILAMVGSKDYFDMKNQGNFNVTTGLRQPGSAIKPINYATALALNFTPATMIPDTPITYHIPGQPAYTPRNYDNQSHGNVPLRVALGSSYNIPAVKVLSAVGVNRMIEQGRKMGITTWVDPSRYGLSLTLGGGEVKMIDMAVVYGTLANMGIKANLHPILEVKDYKGKLLEKLEIPSSENMIAGERVLDSGIAYLLTDILSDNSARTPAFGPNSALAIAGKSVAVKTGTSNNLKDNWAVGYTPSFLVATWVGNNDASPMAYVASGVTGASPIWHNIMSEILKDKASEKYTAPANVKKVEICVNTNSLPCEGCPQTRWEWFLEGTQPKNRCTPAELQAQPTP